MPQPRVRFAPSPTGDLHMGGARTALFNWLFARRNGGTFVLRIEDTDRERSTEESTRGILDGLSWLGLDWDEGPYYQSSRTGLYKDAIEALLENGSAYYDFSDPDTISADRKAAQSEGKRYVYDRHGMERDIEKARRRLAAGEQAAVRLFIPEGETRFDDLVSGEVSFLNSNIEDFVLARLDGSPTYMLSVVVDDADMGITHVIRGNDHIANTPKQILIYKALGKTPPVFAHLPLIHGPDKKKLSKRHGGTTVGEYMGKGYLPRAMLNFLALLGWSPGDEREVMTLDEMIKAFDIDRVNKSAAVFDVEKLNWINSSAISLAGNSELVPEMRKGLEQLGLWHDRLAAERAGWLNDVLNLVKERARLTTSLAEDAVYFFRAPQEYDQKAVKKRCKDEQTPENLRALANKFEQLADWEPEALEQSLRELAESLEVGAGKLIHPMRIGITGTGVSPDIFTICSLLGKDEVSERIKAFAGYLEG